MSELNYVLQKIQNLYDPVTSISPCWHSPTLIFEIFFFSLLHNSTAQE